MDCSDPLVYSFLLAKHVVGATNPTFEDGRILRKSYLGDDQGASDDDKDATAVHVVLYIDETLYKHEKRQIEIVEHMKKVTGLSKTTKFRHVTPEEIAVVKGERKYKPHALKAIGYLRLHRASRWPSVGRFNMITGFVDQHYIANDFRKLSLGRFLMQEAEKVCLNAFHATTLVLISPSESEAFFKKLGFCRKSTKEPIIEKGSPRIFMWKRLSGLDKATSRL